ncbi:hypothetical protein Tco_0950646 [Tanacetum coccineum]
MLLTGELFAYGVRFDQASTGLTTLLVLQQVLGNTLNLGLLETDLMDYLWPCDDIYQDKKACGCGLVLWDDLRGLMDSPEVNDGSDVWKNQHTWNIQSWKLYSFSGVHVLETVGGLVLHMFMDKKYVVPTGRVVVPTGRYVVPAGKVIIIVSLGRVKYLFQDTILVSRDEDMHELNKED